MTGPQLMVRAEQPGDEAEIRRLNDQAFGQPDESRIVDLCRQAGRAVVSLVMVDESGILGHILFTPVTIEPPTVIRAVGLGPMAVLPSRQRQGMGSMLVEAGVRECQDLGYDAAVVLGHPGFYPRFGFRPASAFKLRCTYAVPDDVFMAIELTPGVLTRTVGGTVHYGPEFG